MQDPTKKIEVELSVKTSKFEDELKRVSKSTPGLEALSKRLGTKQTQVENNILKMRMKLDGPQASKKATQHNQKVLKSEQLKLALLKQQTKEVKNLNKELQKTQAFNKKFSGKLGGSPTAGGVGGAAKMLGGMGIAAVVSALGAAVGAVSSQVREGYGKYSQYRQAQGAMVGMGATRKQLDARVEDGAKRGYRPTETMQQALMAAKATGQAGSVTTLQDLTRTIGMDTGSAAGLMGQLARGGQSFTGEAGSKGKRELEKSLAAGFASGLDRARMPEFIQGVGKLVEMQGGRQGGDVSSVGFATILGAMGKTKLSGMEGARGAGALSQLNEAMVKPGGGDYGQALMLQAMGFGKPGGDTSYYEALKKQERGATDPENVKALFAETKSQYGGGQEQILALREMTGLSITQLEGMRSAVDNFDNAGLLEAIEKAQPIEEQSLKAMEGIGDHIERIADLDTRLLGIGTETAASIEKIQDSTNAMIDLAIPLAKSTLGVTSDLLWAFREQFKQDQDPGAHGNTSKQDLLNIRDSTNVAYSRLGKVSGEQVFDTLKGGSTTLGSIASSEKASEWVRNKAGTLQDPVNSQLKALGGRTQAGLVGQLFSDKPLGLSETHEAVRDKVRARWEDALKTNDDRADEKNILMELRSSAGGELGDLVSALHRQNQITAAALEAQRRTDNTGPTNSKDSPVVQTDEIIMSAVIGE